MWPCLDPKKVKSIMGHVINHCNTKEVTFQYQKGIRFLFLNTPKITFLNTPDVKNLGSVGIPPHSTKEILKTFEITKLCLYMSIVPSNTKKPARNHWELSLRKFERS